MGASSRTNAMLGRLPAAPPRGGREGVHFSRAIRSCPTAGDSIPFIGYPAVHHLTGELRRRAATAGDAARLHIWAGTGYRQAEARPASMIIEAFSQPR
jgi:hypothetical protein